ncbi:LysM peptidoglycan-binding domain-containing protein [Mesobacillus zeae]|nr:LysM peptidoglycan-binding domain-containing protein [Mesobacillus zeae]
MGNHQSCLRFSLEESVWFQRGQEVAELVSISLDPNISIQENDQYVTIRGSLELTGEYKCFEGEEEITAEEEMFLAPKTIHSVSRNDEENMEFAHRFPVDITIPKNRIESIYDLNILVETFDYALPEKNSLSLTADLYITGLYGEQQHGSEAPSSYAIETGETIPELYREPEADVPEQYREPEAVSELFREPENDLPEPVPLEFSESLFSLEEGMYGDQETVAAPEKDEEFAPFTAEARKEPGQSEESQSAKVIEIAELVSNTNRGETQPEAQPETAAKQEAEQDEEAADTGKREEPAAQNAPVPPADVKEFELEIKGSAPKEAEKEEESSSSSEEAVKQKKKSKKKSLSIAEFLARKEETEIAKIRVCIVQHGDTIQQIADRYEVSVQHLLRANHFGIDQEIEEGQVLYVPAEYAPQQK